MRTQEMLFQLVSVFAALASFSDATPTAVAPRALKGFNVPQVATGKKVLRSGPVAYHNALAKYNATIPATLVAAAIAAEVSGSVVASPEQYDLEYLCPVQIGTPPQTLMLDFDTGSADLWVFSGRLSAAQRKGHTSYIIKNSATAVQAKGETWDISYADGSGASGLVFWDKVVIGPVTATSQAVEAATSVSSSFITNTDSDGLVGLASTSINTARPNQVQTFFDTIRANLPSPIFTSYLKHNAPGAYGFGFLNSSEYTGSITYAPVNNANGFWEFNAAGYSVGNKTYKLTLDVIADTGTTLNLLPLAVVKKYYAQVPGSSNSDTEGGYIFPCSATLPDFSVTIKGVSFTIPGSYMNYAPCSDSSTSCYGGLQASTGLSFGILGDVFLKSVYAVYDAGNAKIGFAKQAA